MTEEQAACLDRAIDALESAQILHASHKSRDAISRSYYAMFSAATALLLERPGIAHKKHRAVFAAIGVHWVQTKQLEPEYHRWLVSAFNARGKADYTIGQIYNEEDAELQILHAQAFLKRVREILNEQSSQPQ